LNFGASFWFKNPRVFCAILRESSAAQMTKQNQRRRPTSHRKFEHEVRKSDPKFDPFGKTDKAIKQSNPQKFEQNYANQRELSEPKSNHRNLEATKTQPKGDRSQETIFRKNSEFQNPESRISNQSIQVGMSGLDSRILIFRLL